MGNVQLKSQNTGSERSAGLLKVHHANVHISAEETELQLFCSNQAAELEEGISNTIPFIHLYLLHEHRDPMASYTCSHRNKLSRGFRMADPGPGLIHGPFMETTAILLHPV